MNLFNNISTQEFIDQYWQQNVYIARQTLVDLKQIIDGDYLAGLACEDEIDSRIIFGHGIDGDWSCQHGPFAEDYFAKLPEKDWTLLIQSVDQYDSELKIILNRFNFLPSWRLDDIMASYAITGGGVGPHFDYYDVFIIQVSGNREWKIAKTCNEDTALQDNEQIKLLSKFESEENHILDAGDMIYIPAGVAHWGTALSNDCISLSIGFRAPSEEDLITETLNTLLSKINELNLSDSIRYRDTSKAIDSHPNKINLYSEGIARSLLSNLGDESIKNIASQAFGQLVTETKDDDFDYDIKQWDLKDLESFCEENKTVKLKHNSSSRFAYTEKHLFVDGQSFNVVEKFSRCICNKSITYRISMSELSVLLELLNFGYINIDK